MDGDDYFRTEGYSCGFMAEDGGWRGGGKLDLGAIRRRILVMGFFGFLLEFTCTVSQLSYEHRYTSRDEFYSCHIMSAKGFQRYCWGKCTCLKEVGGAIGGKY